MKKISTLFAIAALATSSLMTLSCGSSYHGVVVGNYSPVWPITADMEAAAKFAVRAQGRVEGAILTLMEVTKGERQIVQGSNFKMQLKVKRGQETLTAETVVYQDLEPKMHLTSWDWQK